MSQERGQLTEGQDYFCGGCTGHGTVPCDECVEGDTPHGRCFVCKGVGQVTCTVCQAGTVPCAPPDFL